MKIASSTIGMSSQHELLEKDVSQMSMRAWDGNQQVSMKVLEGREKQLQGAEVKLEISQEGKELQAGQGQAVQSAGNAPAIFELSDKDRQKLELLQRFIESLTGKKIRFYVLDRQQSEGQGEVSFKNLKAAMQEAQVQGPPLLGWGFEYHSYEMHAESEKTQFQTAGVVKTADGREINFSMEMVMSRSFISEKRVDIRAGDALRDPLVINFNAPAAQLTQTKFRFDLDADGTEDNISFVRPGSGFLALDKNNDGIINDGTELFGTKSGNGFADLALYDSDGNNWIDENDDIYSKLRIWVKDEKGNDQLLALGQAGVGAVYLGNVSTEFALKDSSNQLQGQVRQTGIFLKENGGVGSVQQVDLAI